MAALHDELPPEMSTRCRLKRSDVAEKAGVKEDLDEDERTALTLVSHSLMPRASWSGTTIRLRRLAVLVGGFPVYVVRVGALVLLLVPVRPLGGATGVGALRLFGVLGVLVPLLLAAPVLLVCHDRTSAVRVPRLRRERAEDIPATGVPTRRRRGPPGPLQRAGNRPLQRIPTTGADLTVVQVFVRRGRDTKGRRAIEGLRSDGTDARLEE